MSVVMRAPPVGPRRAARLHGMSVQPVDPAADGNSSAGVATPPGVDEVRRQGEEEAGSRAVEGPWRRRGALAYGASRSAAGPRVSQAFAASTRPPTCSFA